MTNIDKKERKSRSGEENYQGNPSNDGLAPSIGYRL